MYFQSGTQAPSSALQIWPFGFLMKIHMHFAKWKISMHMFCANLYCNSKLPSRFCVPLPRPAQGKQSFHYSTRWNWDKPYWVSLGTQTDRRKPVSPIFSDVCLLWASVWRERYFWFNLGTVDIGTESARTLRWAKQNQRGEQDLLESDNSTLESTTWRDGTGTG